MLRPRHVVLVVDGEASASDLRPIVEKHVESCEWAGAKAHDLHVDDWNSRGDSINTVTVKAAAEVDNLANYVASYCGIQPVDLLERSIEYVAWASAVTAANVKTVSRSDAAKHAATADSCRQRAESGQSDQDGDHGEEVRRSVKRGYVLECAECGSPHGIEQGQTLTAARSPDNGPAVADGGLVNRKEQLKKRWPNARWAVQMGESPERRRWRNEIESYLEQNPDAKPTEILGQLGLPPEARQVLAEIETGIDPNIPVSFKRPPEWQVKSVEIGEEEYPASAGNGVNMVETHQPVERLLQETKLGGEDAEQIYWRCEKTNVAMWGGESMAGYLVKQGITHPWTVDEIVSPIRIQTSKAHGSKDVR